MSHKLTREDRQRGGWTRARQIADYRRNDPTPAEQAVHDALHALHYSFMVEHEIWTGQYPQWLDVLVTGPKTFAIEVDGSNGWHGDYSSSKMWQYDQTKRAYLQEQGIPLLEVRVSDTNSDTGLQNLICRFCQEHGL